MKTAENAGMNLKFGPDSIPTPMAILLID